jgi:hypothetical protein
MRASWITSLFAGALFATSIHFLEEGDHDLLIMLIFFGTAIVGGGGIGQMREMNAERKKRGLDAFEWMATKDDFTRFYFPVWGRMLIWFFSTIATSMAIQFWFPD